MKCANDAAARDAVSDLANALQSALLLSTQLHRTGDEQLVTALQAALRRATASLQRLRPR